jgi:hypothetical protein
MSLKELLHLDKFRQKIKLDNTGNDFIIFSDEEIVEEAKLKLEKYSNEWNHEYELIYSSYVLEK